MTHLTRRSALVLLAGTAGTAVAGGYALTREVGATDLVRSVLERHLGPITIAEPELSAFVASFAQGQEWLIPSGKLAAGYETAHDIGLVGPARGLLSADDLARIDLFERRLLGEFHQQTTFGFRQGQDDPVAFVSQTACLNPFAEFAA